MSFGNFKEVQFRANGDELRVVTRCEIDRESSRPGVSPIIKGIWVISWEIFRGGQWVQLAETRTVTLKEGMWSCYRKAESTMYPGDTRLDQMARRHYERTGRTIWGNLPPPPPPKKEEKTEMASGQKFWTTIVEGSTTCQGQFMSEDDARDDAERRTQQTGKTVYVLEAIAAVGLPQPKVEWNDKLEMPVLPMAEEPKASYTPGDKISA